MQVGTITPALAPGPDTALLATPLVQFQASFQLIPAGFLTSAEVNEVALELSSALTAWISPAQAFVSANEVSPHNATNSLSLAAASNAATPSVGPAAAPSEAAPSEAPPGSALSTSGLVKRHLLQTSQTYQSTLSFTITFTAVPATASAASQAALNSDTASAIQQAVQPLLVTPTLTPISSAANFALNASVQFPPDNTVSATPSQSTLAAITLLRALTSNAVQTLPGFCQRWGIYSECSLH